MEKLWAAAEAAADSEKFTEWLTRHDQRLEHLSHKAQHLADAAAEACSNVRHLDGEHLAEVADTSCHAHDELYRVYSFLIA
jgi:hypothetical protein